MRTWPRPLVPHLLPWVTYRQLDNWCRMGYWTPTFPPEGIGKPAVVTLDDLEGLGLLGRLSPYLMNTCRGKRLWLPSWAEIRAACDDRGVWIVVGRTIQPWRPGVDAVPVAGVLVDAARVVDEVHEATAAAPPPEPAEALF